MNRRSLYVPEDVEDDLCPVEIYELQDDRMTVWHYCNAEHDGGSRKIDLDNWREAGAADTGGESWHGATLFRLEGFPELHEGLLDYLVDNDYGDFRGQAADGEPDRGFEEDGRGGSPDPRHQQGTQMFPGGIGHAPDGPDPVGARCSDSSAIEPVYKPTQKEDFSSRRLSEVLNQTFGALGDRLPRKGQNQKERSRTSTARLLQCREEPRGQRPHQSLLALDRLP